jgi:hypothetical protein
MQIKNTRSYHLYPADQRPKYMPKTTFFGVFGQFRGHFLVLFLVKIRRE